MASTLRSRFERTFDGRGFKRDSCGNKRVQALPLFGGQLRHSGETRSVWRQRLLHWLSTPDGQAWQAKRNTKSFVDDEAPSEDDLDVENEV